jgi:hypothetical protein
MYTLLHIGLNRVSGVLRFFQENVMFPVANCHHSMLRVAKQLGDLRLDERRRPCEYDCGVEWRDFQEFIPAVFDCFSCNDSNLKAIFIFSLKEFRKTLL